MSIELRRGHINSCALRLESSKSISNRLLILRALSGVDFPIRNLANSDDSRVLLEALSSQAKRIDVGAAGTSYRFLAAYLSVYEGSWTLTGSKRMLQRPIAPLVKALQSMEADIEYLGKSGFPPLAIKGKELAGGEVDIYGGISSQFISALLLIAPALTKGLQLNILGPIVSQPYVGMTLSLLNSFMEGEKIYVGSSDRKEVSQRIVIPSIKGGAANWKIPSNIVAEGDWSAASYFYSLVAIEEGLSLKLSELSKGSIQGDSAVANLYKSFGVATGYEDGQIRIERTAGLKAKLKFNLLKTPDLAQTIIGTCAALRVPAYLVGLQTLAHKETNRLKAMQKELAKFGCILIINEDASTCFVRFDADWKMGEQPTIIETYEDHRMAMSLAPLALKYGPLVFKNPAVVNKSFSSFWTVLKQIGFEIKQQ